MLSSDTRHRVDSLSPSGTAASPADLARTFEGERVPWEDAKDPRTGPDQVEGLWGCGRPRPIPCCALTRLGGSPRIRRFAVLKLAA